MNNIFSDNPTWSIGVIVGLFGILAVNRLNIRREKNAAFRNAARDFIGTMHQELKDIYAVPVNWPGNIDAFLKTKFPALQAAANTFRSHLSSRHREDFDRAWFLYRLGKYGRNIDEQCYFHYMPFGSNPYYKERFKEDVDRLLKFANKT